MNHGLALIAAIGFALILAACGSSGPGAIAPADAARLHAQVAAIRADALAGRAAGAHGALAHLRRELTTLERSGRLEGHDAAILQAAAAAVGAELPTSTSHPTPAAVPTSPAATTNSPARSPSPPRKPGHHHGQDKAHGHGGEDGSKHGHDGG